MADTLPQALTINKPQIHLAIAALGTSVAVISNETAEAERASDEFAKLLAEYRPDCIELITKLKAML